MINYPYENLFKADSVNREILFGISTRTGVSIELTNSDIISGSIELSDSLCSSENLKFGSFEGAELSFITTKINFDYINSYLSFLIMPQGGVGMQIPIGFIIVEESLTSDKSRKKIRAVDLAYFANNYNVASWYNSLTFPMTLKQFRDSLFSNLIVAGVYVHHDTVSLVNDSITIEKTIETNELTLGEVLRKICEINGVFGHFRYAVFRYVSLEKFTTGLYPANDLYPVDDLYPEEPGSKEDFSIITEIGDNGNYIRANFADYFVQPIKKLRIRMEENDIGVIVGTDGNTYVVEDNFLLYGKGTSELTTIANNLLEKISGITYTPCEIEIKGNPCMEVGDAFVLKTRNGVITSYILQRKMSGAQLLRDKYYATGKEQYEEKNVGYNYEIRKLRGKSNVLERTIEETQSIITDDILSPTNPQSLQSQITQNASEIEVIVRQLYGNCEYYERKGAPTLLNYPAWDFCSNIPCNDTVATTNDLGFVYTSTDYFNHLNALVYDTQNNKVYRFVYNSSTLNYEWNDITETETAQILEKISRVSQTVEGLTSTVTATELEVSDHEFRIRKNESEITQQADRIELKVSRDDVVSSINQSAEEISIDANRINLNGAVTANNNVEIDTNGQIYIKDGQIINKVGTDEIVINDIISFKSYSDYWDNWYTNMTLTPIASGSLDFYYHDTSRHEYGIWGGKVYGDAVVGGVAIQTHAQGVISMYIGISNKMFEIQPNAGFLLNTWYGNLNSPSDRDLKKNIKDINKALIEIVGDIPLKQFEFKSNEGVVEIGIIAQDLAEELEKQGLTDYGIVSTFTQDGKEYKAVNYTEFLIARNKYLEQRIDDLERRIERLENLMKGENK